MSVMFIECKDCGKKFEIEEKEQQWYEDKGLTLPKRCTGCRQKNRERREKEGR